MAQIPRGFFARRIDDPLFSHHKTSILTSVTANPVFFKNKNVSAFRIISSSSVWLPPRLLQLTPLRLLLVHDVGSIGVFFEFMILSGCSAVFTESLDCGDNSPLDFYGDPCGHSSCFTSWRLYHHPSVALGSYFIKK